MDVCQIDGDCYWFSSALSWSFTELASFYSCRFQQGTLIYCLPRRKSVLYTNSNTHPFLTFCIYYTPKFPESQNSNVSLWQNTQSTNAHFVGILNAGSRAPYIPFRIHGSFLLRNGKQQITEGVSRPPTVAYSQALPSFLCRRTLRPAICT